MRRQPLPDLDRRAATSLAEQIAAFYREAILAGRLSAGDRLPPIREVAVATGVTRATVQEAYRRLAENELVEGTVGRGTTVLRGKALGGHLPDAGPLSSYAAAALRQTQSMPGAPPLPKGRGLVANFAELAPDVARFPVEELRLAMDQVLRTRGAELLGYAHAANGMPELRALLVGDTDASPDEMLVTTGAQQALDLVLRTFCAPGDAVVLTDPSYHQMHGLLKAHGLRSLPIALGDRGVDLDGLAAAVQKPDVRLVYLMPTFHNPTGRTIDLAQRRAVIEVMSKTSVPILEDEYQLPLRFRGDHLPSLRSLDPRGLTVTALTFSKGLFPGLRMGWVQAGPALLRPMTAVKRFMDLETSPLLQAALAEFLGRGAMERYLHALRTELRLRHDALQRTMREHLPPECTVTDPDGGFLVWLELPEPGHGDRLAEVAAEHGVRVLPGRIFDALGRPSRGVRLSLSRANVPQIEAGARILAECARELLFAQPAASARTFL
jgi:2-aminoadipate transaminase